MSVYIIAEAGVNHNGSSDLAFELIDVAADAGADAVKFQTFKADEMITVDTGKASYQQSNTNPIETQFAMLKKLELPFELHFRLQEHANNRGIDFLSTAFDFKSLDFLLSDLVLKTIKISSGELTNHPLLYAHAIKGINMILSTGMAEIDEIRQSLSVMAFGLMSYNGYNARPSINEFKRCFDSEEGQRLLKDHVTLLHCTSDYPTKLGNVNMRAMNALKEEFLLPVGYSDHTLSTDVAAVAVASGATILEKHFTIDTALDGPDHAMSLNPNELQEYVQCARQAELILGDRIKTLTSGELKNRTIGRKSVTAIKNINKGDVFSSSNIGFKRTKKNGISPAYYWNILGEVAACNIEIDEVLMAEQVVELELTNEKIT